MRERIRIDPEMDKRIREKTIFYFQMTHVTWRWWNFPRRIRRQWERFKVLHKAQQRKRLYDFTNDIQVTRTKKVIRELPDRKA